MEFEKEIIKNIAPMLIYIYSIIGIILLSLFIILRIKKKKYKKAGIYEIDKMTGEEFENFCKALLERYNFKVKKTKKFGDYGVDLIATNGKRKIAIQCKRWNRKVNIKAIQEVVAGKNYYRCNEAMVITNNFFTDNAIKLANKNKVKIIDRKKLTEIILKSKK